MRNNKLELFVLEHPKFEPMVTYLTESPENVVTCLEYSDWLYEKGDALLVAGLVETHGDKVVEPLFRAFDMEDEIIEALERDCPLNSLRYMPKSFVSPRIIALYINEGIVNGLSDVVEDEDELLNYYRLAAKNVSSTSTSINSFFCIWNTEDEECRNILIKNLFNYYIAYGSCKEIKQTMIDYFKDNYNIFPDIYSKAIYEMACFENGEGTRLDTLKYYFMMMTCKEVSMYSIKWLLNRLLNDGNKDYFERLVLKATDWSTHTLKDYARGPLYRKIKRVLRKNGIKVLK